MTSILKSTVSKLGEVLFRKPLNIQTLSKLTLIKWFLDLSLGFMQGLWPGFMLLYQTWHGKFGRKAKQRMEEFKVFKRLRTSVSRTRKPPPQINQNTLVWPRIVSHIKQPGWVSQLSTSLATRKNQTQTSVFSLDWSNFPICLRL